MKYSQFTRFYVFVCPQKCMRYSHVLRCLMIVAVFGAYINISHTSSNT